MKRVVIIDDEPLARAIVTEYLQAHGGFEVIAECGNGFEGVKAITRHRPDLVILDVQMPKINGFEMLELLDELPQVIFATAFDEYALKAFEANAVDYLLKPFSQERFNAALARLGTSPVDSKMASLLESAVQPEEKNRIVVRTNSEISIIPLNEVVYIEAYDDYVKIFTKDNYFLKKKTMNYYEEILDPARFFRTHRSYIVNLAYLTRIEPLEKNSYVVILKSGKKIPLSRGSYGKLKLLLGI
jgi:two-component system LytT family response regulator